jgi:hypothetical protein
LDRQFLLILRRTDVQIRLPISGDLPLSAADSFFCMNTRSIGLVSVVLNVALAAAVLLLPGPSPTPTLSATPNKFPSTTLDERRETAKKLLPHSASVQEAMADTPGKFNWSALKSNELRTYIANLRAVDCPEETIRDIIVAEVDKLYAGRLRALSAPGGEFHYWKSERNWNSKESRDLQKQRTDLQKEKSDLLVQLLGIDPEKQERKERGIVDYYERMYSFLPDDKQSKVREIQEKYEPLRQEIYNGDMDDEDAKKIRDIYRKQIDEISQFLTPSELEQYELCSSQTASQLRYDLDGAEPTEQEFREIYKIRKAHEDDLAYSFDPDNKDAQKRRETALKDVNKEVAAVLGTDRATEIERAQDWSYKELARMTAKLDLPKDTASKVYDIKKAAEDQAKQLQTDSNLQPKERQEALKKLRADTETEIGTMIGDKNLEKYKRRGGHWISNLSPGR